MRAILTIDQGKRIRVEKSGYVTGVFTQVGYLHVTTNPPVPATIYVNEVAMDDWDVWVSFAPGSYTVSFGDAPGYTKPAEQVVTVTAGATTNVTGNYTYVSTVSETTTKTGTTPLSPGAGPIPGFPAESILAGLVSGAIVLLVLRRHSRT